MRDADHWFWGLNKLLTAPSIPLSTGQSWRRDHGPRHRDQFVFDQRHQKKLAKTVHRLTLPRNHLVWMELVLGRNSLDRLVAPKGVKSYAGLKIRDKITSFSHLVFLLQRMEYTLSPCPIFRDHLSLHSLLPDIRNFCNLWQNPRPMDFWQNLLE